MCHWGVQREHKEKQQNVHNPTQHLSIGLTNYGLARHTATTAIFQSPRWGLGGRGACTRTGSGSPPLFTYLGHTITGIGDKGKARDVLVTNLQSQIAEHGVLPLIRLEGAERQPCAAFHMDAPEPLSGGRVLGQ